MSAAVFYPVYKIHIDSIFGNSEQILYFSMSLKEAGEVVIIIIIFLVVRLAEYFYYELWNTGSFHYTGNLVEPNRLGKVWGRMNYK